MKRLLSCILFFLHVLASLRSISAAFPTRIGGSHNFILGRLTIHLSFDLCDICSFFNEFLSVIIAFVVVFDLVDWSRWRDVVWSFSFIFECICFFPLVLSIRLSSLEKSSGDCYGFEVLAIFLEWRGWSSFLRSFLRKFGFLVLILLLFRFLFAVNRSNWWTLGLFRWFLGLFISGGFVVRTFKKSGVCCRLRDFVRTSGW